LIIFSMIDLADGLELRLGVGGEGQLLALRSNSTEAAEPLKS
jgi:hypothetical protein